MWVHHCMQIYIKDLSTICPWLKDSSDNAKESCIYNASSFDAYNINCVKMHSRTVQLVTRQTVHGLIRFLFMNYDKLW